MINNVNQVPNQPTSNQFNPEIEPESEQKRSELMTASAQKLAARLRKYIEETGLSNSSIVRQVEAHPDYGKPEFGTTSTSTVQRVRSGENVSMASLLPLANALLGVDAAGSDEFDEKKAKEYYLECSALRALVEAKENHEVQLQEHIKEAEVRHRDEMGRLSMLHDTNIQQLLTLHSEHKSGQEHSITILEKENEFLRSELTAERESRKRLYDDLKKYMDKYGELSEAVGKLQKFHEDDD